MTINILKKSRKKKPEKSTFHLFHYFYLVAIGAIVIILFVAGLGLRHILRDFAIHAAEHTAIHISSALSDNQIEQFMSSRRNEKQLLSISQEKLPKLDRAMRKFLLSFEVVKVKIYDAEKRIVYSTDLEIIGKIDSDNDMLATALNGTAISKYEREDTLWDLEGEQRYNVQIVETYVPIHSSDGKIIGSFEIYKDITDHISMMQKHLVFAWATLCITVLVVFTTLMIIINRASQAINSHTNDIMATNKSLELEIINREKIEREKRILKTQLHQAQKIEAIGTLAGGIAHDFNNILTAMVGYAELALDDIQEEKITTRTNLEQVLIAGNRAKELVKQILTFSHKTDQEQKPIEIASIVKEALKMLRSSTSTTIEIRQNIEADSSVIMANPTQIHQVLVNLCTNAVHAMSGKNGLLEVNLTEIDIESDIVTNNGDLQKGKYLKLTVKDTGCGMDSQVVKRVFEPFFTTKEVDKGTGMGLSVVHGIVKDHGGTIAVDSTPGEGTTFNIFFPKIDSAQMQEVESFEVVSGQGELIFLVDDEKPIVDMMTQMLERLGYTVVGKTNSIDALETFRAEPDKFDLVITDYAMPDMSGKELAKELMSIRADIPVILCTGFSEDIDSEEARSMGIKEFVLKPVAREKLSVIIRNILDKKEITV